jgi:S-DNA-T family DNA segregation ATPase FtsK/SpoIIIE
VAQQRRKKTKRRGTSRKNNNEISEHVIGALFIAFSLLGGLHLGYLGTLFANVLRIFVGDAYQVAAGLLALLGSYLLIVGKEPQIKAQLLWGAGVFSSGALLLMHALFFARLDLHAKFIDITWQYLFLDIAHATAATPVGGGLLGACLYAIAYFLLAQLGSYLLSGFLMLLGVCLLCNVSLAEVLKKGGQGIYQGLLLLKRLGYSVATKRRQRTKKVAKPLEQPAKTPLSLEPVTSPKTTQEVLEPIEIQEFNEKTLETAPKKQAEPAFTLTPSDPNYQLPGLELLDDVKAIDQSKEKSTILKNQAILQKTFKSFGVDVELKNTILGPAVTKYELHPAIGVKVSKIVNLSDDLALALAAKDIRIEAPIPGKSLIGIEVPNQEVATISFKDVIAAQKKNPNKPLEVPLGRDISGNLVVADLAKMPHLLIAGSTGSGKSVAINGIITSLLMNCPPDRVKLMLVDPKKVELGVYNDIAHLLTPVVTEPKKAARALHKLVTEMERRYELFANTGQRNIAGYNQMIERQNQELNTKEPTLPYIVAVVDELSDLMMVASNEVEDAIIRLAQMARAAGIHMILATQRPSVDVITGLIKANVPSRMAFAVSSGTDSRTIIDQSGAEKLLGRGDMLFLPMGTNKPLRVQGAFISDADVQRVVDFVKKQRSAVYDEKLTVSDEEAQQDLQEDQEDELFSQAVEFIKSEQKCSISLLQRRFKIGYNRAARIVDELDKRGMIGPQEGSKPRKVYLNKEDN